MVANVLIMYVQVIWINHQGDVGKDLPLYLLNTFLSLGTLLIYMFLDSQNVLANIRHKISTFEYEQYKEMFNSLQEGVLVIDSETTDADGFQVFFANELMQKLMTKVLDVKASHDEKDFKNISANVGKPLFYVYRREMANQEKQERMSRSFGQSSRTSRSNRVKRYSLKQIMNMSQNQLSQLVFMFNDKTTDLLDKDEFTEIQNVLKDCQLFQDLETDLVPTYKFFQIKKTQIKRESKASRFTLQLIDISAKIFYDDIKATEEFMNITTSTISHEMRNPLNSILGQCSI